MFSKKENLKFILDNAVIIDVRSPEEFSSGSIHGSKNIPLNTISSRAKEIKSWEKPIVLCCASGVRSGRAMIILKLNGVKAYNGKGWISLREKLNTK